MLAMIGILESAGVVILTIGLVWRSWDRNARGPIWWMLIGGALLVIGLLMEPVGNALAHRLRDFGSRHCDV